MKNVKIVFLMTQSMESPYGIGRSGPLAKEFVRLGYSVQILALHPNLSSLTKTEFDFQGVHVKYVAPMHVVKLGKVKTYYPTIKLLQITLLATWQLTLAALNSSADIIIICKPHPMNGIAGLLTGWIKRRIIWVDSDDYEAGSGNFKKRWQRILVEFFEHLIPKFSHIVTTNTTFMRQNLIKWGVKPEKIIMLPNGADSETF